MTRPATLAALAAALTLSLGCPTTADVASHLQVDKDQSGMSMVTLEQDIIGAVP